jgi:hypothetical protein
MEKILSKKGAGSSNGPSQIEVVDLENESTEKKTQKKEKKEKRGFFSTFTRARAQSASKKDKGNKPDDDEDTNNQNEEESNSNPTLTTSTSFESERNSKNTVNGTELGNGKTRVKSTNGGWKNIKSRLSVFVSPDGLENTDLEDGITPSEETNETPPQWMLPTLQVPSEPPVHLSPDVDGGTSLLERTLVAWELYCTELNYLRSLEILQKYFLEPLRNPNSPYFRFLSEEEIKILFPVLDELR